MTLTVFDLDKTLIQGDSNELWHEFLYERGVLDKAFMDQDAYLMDLYAKGELDMDEYLAFAIKGLNVIGEEEVERLMPQYLESKIRPIIYKQTPTLIKEAKNRLIISATPEFVVGEVAKFLGIDAYIGMRLLKKDGLYTGEYESPLSYKDGKVECLKQWLNQKGIEPKRVIFYSDSINDLPLLEYANEAYCVNPDIKLQSVAKQKGWDILNFSS